MTSSPKIYPIEFKFAAILISICLTLGLVYIGQDIIFPILLALLFAILLRPLVDFLIRKAKFPNLLAVSTALLIALIVVVALVIFLSKQLGNIGHDYQKINSNIHTHLDNIQRWISEKFNISNSEQTKYLKQATKNSMSKSGTFFSNTLSSFSDLIVNLILIPIYTFLLLLYRRLLINFLFKLIDKKNHQKLTDILSQVKLSIQSYLLGIITEMSIVASLTTIGYFIIGIPYALLLGIITGLLNLIPYIGIIMAAALSILATLSNSTDLSIIAGVLVVNGIVQFFDNNILVPMVVGSKVKINALVSLIGILIAGAIGGVIGMFLALPIIAILKVIFDRIDFLAPFGYAMGENLPEENKVTKPRFSFFRFKKKKNNKVK